MSMAFNSPLGKKLTESETVIAGLVVEDTLALAFAQANQRAVTSVTVYTCKFRV